MLMHSTLLGTDSSRANIVARFTYRWMEVQQVDQYLILLLISKVGHGVVVYVVSGITDLASYRWCLSHLRLGKSRQLSIDNPRLAW